MCTDVSVCESVHIDVRVFVKERESVCTDVSVCASVHIGVCVSEERVCVCQKSVCVY